MDKGDENKIQSAVKQFIDDDYQDQLELSSQLNAVNIQEPTVGSGYPNLHLLPDMYMERNRVYNFTSALDLYTPEENIPHMERTYVIPPTEPYHLLYRQHPSSVPTSLARQRSGILPRFVRSLNPFKKKE